MGDGEEQVHQVHAKFLPLAQGERSADDLLAARIQDGGLTKVGDQEGEREENGEQAADRDLLAHEIISRVIEFLLLALFARKGFNDFDSGQVLLQDCVEG